MSKIDAVLLKIHSWIYRVFGIYTSYAQKREQEYVDKTLDKNSSDFTKDLTVGLWQANNGFYRKYRGRK